MGRLELNNIHLKMLEPSKIGHILDNDYFFHEYMGLVVYQQS